MGAGEEGYIGCEIVVHLIRIMIKQILNKELEFIKMFIHSRQGWIGRIRGGICRNINKNRITFINNWYKSWKNVEMQEIE